MFYPHVFFTAFMFMALPGPVSLYIASTALSGRLTRALLLGVGVALVDAVYILFAVLGIGTLMVSLPFVKLILLSVGALFLLKLGIAHIGSRLVEDMAEDSRGEVHVWNSILEGALLTAPNPGTVLGITMLGSSLMLGFPSATSRLLVAIPVSMLLASLSYWCCLSCVMHAAGMRLGMRIRSLMGIIGGGVLCIVGGKFLVEVVMSIILMVS